MERIDGSGNLIERWDYAGSFVFEGGSLSEVLTEEGRLIPWRKIKPDFFVRDHLGSVRAVVSGDGRVLEANSYYPYGMKIDALSSTNYTSSDVPNRYKYNGKEEVEDLQWLNYGTRFYDAAVARWWVRDPKAVKYYALTPYSYVGGNPVRMVDPYGDTIRISTGSNSIVYSAGMKYAGNDEFVSTTIEYLNLIYDVKMGREVLNRIMNSENSYIIENTPSVGGNNTAQFDKSKNIIRAAVLMNSKYPESEKMGALAHELFHVYQDINGRNPHTINAEVEAYLFGRVTASFATGYGGMIGNFGKSTTIGIKYDNFMFNLIFGKDGYDIENYKAEYMNAVKCFKAGSIANEYGLYNRYKIDLNYKPLILKFVPLYEYNIK